MSSSSDEDLSKFSEAADAQLFNNRLYSDNKDAAESTINTPAKTSLRKLDAPEENRTDLRVTPGFQKHVANKLMKILDSSLDTDTNLQGATCNTEPDPNGNSTKTSPPNPASGGIKLFGASAAFIASCNITPPPPTKRRKRGRTTFLSSESEDDSSNNEADSSNLSNKDSPSAPKKLGTKDETELSEKFAACAVSSEWILNGEAVKGWAPPFKNKAAIEGKCTPEVLDLLASVKIKSKKKKDKKKRKRTEEPATIDMVIEKTEKLSIRRKKRGKRAKKGKDKKGEKLENAADTQESGLLDRSKSSKKKKKKKKSSKRSKLEGASGDDDLQALLYLKKLKRKKRRKQAKLEAVQGVLEDEGFDSDPMNTVKKFTQKEFKDELLLLTRLRHEAKLKKT